MSLQSYNISLNKVGNDLIGEMVPEISQLEYLQYLTLTGNCLYGTIPPELGLMSSLLSIELHGNGLSGELPRELSDASNLQLLNVAMQYQHSYQCTRSNGQIIQTLFKMGGTVEPLEYNNGLHGPVLEEGISALANLKGLHIFDNSFGGTISDMIGDLKNLSKSIFFVHLFSFADNSLFAYISCSLR